jgi:catechol 2,3-dioxygenase-like lactoylglutathione lyase family enzyme
MSKLKPPQVEITAIDHIYLTVTDLKVSEKFYDRVMRLFGFHKGTDPIEGEPHLHYYNRDVRLTLRPARPAKPAHDPYAPGLHHICLRVADPQAVDAAWQGLTNLGIEASYPLHYPQYAPDYYATFFADPDGIRLEIVNHLAVRREIRELWDQLEDFENPLRKLRARKAAR